MTDEEQYASNQMNFVFNADGIESTDNEEELQALALADDVRSVTVVTRIGPVAILTQNFWKGEGGRTPTYSLHPSGALIVYADDDVHITYGPSAWMMVKGPEKQGQARLLA